MNAFSTLGLNAELVAAVEDLGFETPSEIQEKAIPLLLEQETDLVALAQTGTGKTAAFGLPLLQHIDVNSKQTQGLILSPTRELCLQITNEIQNYGKKIKGLRTVAVYGGASITDQARQINRGAHVIVATPGRMKDMIRRKIIDITNIEYCILDEADEMLNMGFYEDITDILSGTPDDKSTWLFSATMPKEVATIAKKFMHSPHEITVGTKNTGAKNVTHEYYMVGGRDRYRALKRLADANPDIFSVIFCRTKRDTQKVAEQLITDGYNAAAIHGDLSQAQRDLVMNSFRKRQVSMLVATDVAARGIDVDDITHVINYQLPDEIETYTHRSGRTGRAGKTGTSMVIITKSEFRKIRQIEKVISKSFEQKELPSGKEICKTQLLHLANSVKKTEINHEIDAFLPQIEEILEGYSKEELIKKFFTVEFTRFFNYYKNEPKINTPSADGKDYAQSNGNEVRYFINLGERDDFNWMTLKDYLKDNLNLGRDGVFKVDVMNSFAFFNTEADKQEQVFELAQELTHNGRKVEIELTKDKGNRGGKPGRRSGGGGKRRRSDGEGGSRRRSESRGGDRGFSGGSRRSGGGASGKGKKPSFQSRSKRRSK
ncbi:DEAD/DEAH box helicase [Gangjinia marincola]|uniref:RNA helicase n=1 Tax=Gangjinia marincola TaxID=578463 RepID=A0ABP3XVQ8_9FLAO